MRVLGVEGSEKKKRFPPPRIISGTALRRNYPWAELLNLVVHSIEVKDKLTRDQQNVVKS